MKDNRLLKAAIIISATLFSLACGSASDKETEKKENVQDTSMPNKQNDGYPYTNPTTRIDTAKRDSSVKH